MAIPQDVLKLLIIRAIRAFMIVMPVIVLYWQSYGLSLQEIFWLQVIFSLAVVVLEIPSGYFADRVGRKTSVILSTVTASLGYLGYYIATDFWGFVVAELLLAVSVSFLSGAVEALLYATLKDAGSAATYQRYAGRLLSIGTVSEAIAALAAGVVASRTDIQTVFLVQCLISLLAIGVACTLSSDTKNGTRKPAALLAIIKGSLKDNARLRALNLFAGAVSAGSLTMVWLAQPHWESLGVDVLWIGYLWAGLNLTAAFGAYVAHHVERILWFRVIFGGLALSPILLYGSLSLFSTSVVSVAIAFGFWLIRGLSVPIVQDYVQREAKDDERATVMSITQLSSRLIFSICSPFVGWVADVSTFQEAFLTAGVIFGTLSVVGFLLWLHARRVR